VLLRNGIPSTRLKAKVPDASTHEHKKAACVRSRNASLRYTAMQTLNVSLRLDQAYQTLFVANPELRA
jgi:hypothetical protein